MCCTSRDFVLVLRPKPTKASVQLILWIAVCVTGAFLLRNRPVITVALAVFMRVAIPSAAVEFVTGRTADSQLQPASYFVLAALAVALLFGRDRVWSELSRHVVFYAAVAVLFAAALLITVTQRPESSTLFLFDTLGCGIVLCLLARSAFDGSVENGRLLALAVVFIASCEAILGIAQWASGRTLLWERYMANYYWWTPQAARVTGTAGSWLDFALLLAIAVPLAACIRRPALRFAVAALLSVGILLSQSRVPLALALVGMAYLIFLSQRGLFVKVIWSLVVVAVGWIAFQAGLAGGLASRIATDTTSTLARAQALRFVFENFSRQPWTGTGFGSNSLTRESGLISSFENGYLMYLWDFGLVFTLLFIVVVLSQLVAQRRQRTPIPGGWLALAISAVAIGAYSGLETAGPGSWLLFLALAFAAPLPHRKVEQRQERTRLAESASSVAPKARAGALP